MAPCSALFPTPNVWPNSPVPGSNSSVPFYCFKWIKAHILLWPCTTCLRLPLQLHSMPCSLFQFPEHARSSPFGFLCKLPGKVYLFLSLQLTLANLYTSFSGGCLLWNYRQQFSECGLWRSKQQAYLRPRKKRKFSGPTPALLNQKLWAWGPALQVILCWLKIENHQGFSALTLFHSTLLFKCSTCGHVLSPSTLQKLTMSSDTAPCSWGDPG